MKERSQPPALHVGPPLELGATQGGKIREKVAGVRREDPLMVVLLRGAAIRTIDLQAVMTDSVSPAARRIASPTRFLMYQSVCRSACLAASGSRSDQSRSTSWSRRA
jgi:hypothetical protein